MGLSLNKYRSLVLGRSVKDLHVTSDPVAYGFNDNDNPIGHFSGHTSPTAVETAVRDTSASLLGPLERDLERKQRRHAVGGT